MKKIIAAVLLTLVSTGTCIAQDVSGTDKKAHEFDHIIGVQINELTKQILGVNNSNAATANPYMLTYNLTERTSGLGFRAGTGFNYISKSSDGGGKLKSQSFDIRVGFEKAFKLSDKFSTGIGLDLVYKYKDSSLTQMSAYGYDLSYNSKKMGLGPMGWLRCNLSKRILIGTEMSMYFLTGHEKTTGTFFGTEVNDKVSEFKSNLPVTFFLSLKL